MEFKKSPEGLVYVPHLLITESEFNTNEIKDMDFKSILFLKEVDTSRYSDFTLFFSFKKKGFKQVTISKFSGFKRSDIIFGFERDTKDKMHVRNSGMNQVVAKWLRDNNIIYALELETLNSLTYGKVKQNLLLLRKYSVPIIVFSKTRLFSWFEAMQLMRSILTQ